jgi:hypothetical protein
VTLDWVPRWKQEQLTAKRMPHCTSAGCSVVGCRSANHLRFSPTIAAAGRGGP